MRYRLALTVAAFCVASGIAEGGEDVAEFLPLRSNVWPFAALSEHWPQTGRNSILSGDGNTVTDGWWRWTRTGGITPRGFVPAFGTATVSRYPRGLSFDGSIEFGQLQDTSNTSWLAHYWEDSSRFDVVNLTFPAAYTVESRTLSGDGNWIFFDSGGASNPRRHFRQSRDGLREEFPQLGPSGSIQGPSANGTSGHTNYGVLVIPAGLQASDAILIPKPEGMQSYTIASSGAFVVGANHPVGSPVSVIWNVGTGDTQRFNPPLGYSGGYSYGGMWLSDDGALVAGVVSHWYSPSEPVVFVRSAGEQSRKLSDVLRRFGSNAGLYFSIQTLWGASSDGRTLLVYVTSPWYGDSAAIVVLPQWEACPADINFDGVVDDADFSAFVLAYNALTNTDGDLNVDGVTDDADFVMFVAAYEELLCP